MRQLVIKIVFALYTYFKFQSNILYQDKLTLQIEIFLCKKKQNKTGMTSISNYGHHNLKKK